MSAHGSPWPQLSPSSISEAKEPFRRKNVSKIVRGEGAAARNMEDLDWGLSGCRGARLVYWHTTVPISSPEHTSRREAIPRFPLGAHAKLTTFIVGRLYAHVFSCPVADAMRKLKMGSRGAAVLSQIWPVIDRQLEWPKNLMTSQGTPPASRWRSSTSSGAFRPQDHSKVDRLARDSPTAPWR